MENLGHEHSSRAASLLLRGGCACLDFANTASSRGGPLHLEHLQAPVQLADWAGHAALLSPQQQLRMKRSFKTRPGAARDMLKRALELREAIYAIGRSWAAGRRAPRKALAKLAEQHAEALGHAKLVEEKGGIAWQWPAAADEGSKLIGLLSLSAIDLFSTAEPCRIKCCAGENCGWLFLDTSRNNSRRWCDMQVCGNRAKSRRFRNKDDGGCA